MLGQQFYHETMRKVVVAFGTIFNNINIIRVNNSGAVTQSMKVPLAYGPKQKFLTRLFYESFFQVQLWFAALFFLN